MSMTAAYTNGDSGLPCGMPCVGVTVKEMLESAVLKAKVRLLCSNMHLGEVAVVVGL